MMEEFRSATEEISANMKVIASKIGGEEGELKEGCTGLEYEGACYGSLKTLILLAIITLCLS